MQELPRRKNIRLQGFDYNSKGAYFLTICTLNRSPVLSQIVVGTGVPDGPEGKTGVPDGPEVRLLPYGEIAEKYIHKLNEFYDNISVESYVIMPDHIHMILSIKNEASYNTGPSRTPAQGPSRTPAQGPSRTPVPTAQNSVISRFLSTFKRFCNKEYGENIWQRGSYDHIIRDLEDYDEHLKYIYENPIRWHIEKK